jgi:hypothetical protein
VVHRRRWREMPERLLPSSPIYAVISNLASFSAYNLLKQELEQWHPVAELQKITWAGQLK